MGVVRLVQRADQAQPARFPPDFMFSLTQEEFDSLRSQIATSNRGGRRYLPMAFIYLLCS
ncbi:MAG: ORF6N domain-containing protein [Polaromonas sp.]